MKLDAVPALLERDEEFARIDDTLDDALAGRGGLLLIEGRAGLGKTELMGAARDRARAAGMEVLAAAGSELERSFAYGVARQLFEPRISRAETREQRSLMKGAAALAGPALGVSRADLETDQHGETSLAVLHGLYWLSTNLSQRAPLALAIDDAHWADLPSLRFLVYLLRRLEGLPIAIVVATRPPADAERDLLAELEAHPLGEVVRPRPLSATAARRLVDAAFSEPVDEAFAAACHSATRGNPFLISQLIRGLISEGVAPRAESAASVNQIAPDVAHVIAARVGGAAPGATELVRAVAILGDDADVRDAAALARLDVATAASAADALAAAGILDWRRPLAFVHPLVRAAVYEQVPPRERARGHAEAARVLDANGAPLEAVAAQLLMAEPAGNEGAVRTLQAAAHDALTRGSPDSAATYLARALTEPPAVASRPRLLAELGAAELQSGQLSAAEGASPAAVHLREALELTEDPGRRVAVVRELADALLAAERFTEGAAVLNGELARLGEADETLTFELLSVLALMGFMHAPTAQLAAIQLQRLPHVTGESAAERFLLGVLAVRAVFDGEPATHVARLAERALPRGAVLDSATTPHAPNQTGIALMAVDRLAEAGDLFERVLAEARPRGQVRAMAMALCWLAHVENRGGAVREAEEHAREALDLARLHTWPLDLPATRAALAEALLEQGRAEEAEQAVEGYDPGVAISCTWFLRARAAARAARGRAEDALADLAECAARLDAFGSGGAVLVPWRSTAALVHSSRGDLDEARRLAGEEVEIARAFGAPRALGAALRTAGLVLGREELPLLRESVDVLTDSPARLELAHSAVALGAALRRAGRRVQSRGHLRLALDIAHRCGAATLAETATIELRATGARPRRAVLTGVDALTASERRVADLAARGLTNREIAQALFITPRTVEGHLTHAYQKLGVESRQSLARALGTPTAAHPPSSNAKNEAAVTDRSD